MSSVAEKSHVEQSSIKYVSRFLRQYKIGADLKRAGAYKQKGVPVLLVLKAYGVQFMTINIESNLVKAPKKKEIMKISAMQPYLQA